MVWSNDHTTFAGHLTVAGTGGHGGFAEVSSHRLLDFTGTVDLAGSAGAGTLLLDPYNVIISNGANNTGGSFAGNTNNSVIKVADLEDALSKGNVEVSTGSDGYQAGDITVSDPVSWSANNLTLDAYHSISVNAALSASGNAGLTLITNDGGSGGDLYFGGGSVNFASNNESLIINGHGYTLVSTLPQLANDIAVNSDSGYYALSSNYDAAPFSYASAPINTTFYGTFEGLGHTIADLTISATSEVDVGLFGNSSGTIRDIGMIGESITGGQFVGGLVGINGGTISHAYATGSVTGVDDDVGGLAGLNGGAITESFASDAVASLNGTNVGGLVGLNSGSITDAYATGSVMGTNYGGGLVGENNGVVSDVYATGAVVGGLVGGLVGYNAGSGTITNGYWDTLTDPIPPGIGRDDTGAQMVKGLTTPQLQATSAQPSAISLGGAFWGGAVGGTAGLYPYLRSFYPSPPKAISGFAYSDAGVTPLAPTAFGKNKNYVYALVDGTKLGSVTTGANGYFYFLEAPNVVSSAAAVIAYTTGTDGGATVDVGADPLSGFDVWGDTLIAPTGATTYSAASAGDLKTLDVDLINRAVGSDTAASNLVAGLSFQGYIATGDHFTFDNAVNTNHSLYVRTVTGSAPITVSHPITFSNKDGMTLNAAGALVIDAPISIGNGGAVVLNAADDTTTAPGHSLLELSFGPSGSIDFSQASYDSGTLNINGTPYTLLYTLNDIQNINSSDTTLGRHYALTGSLDPADVAAYLTSFSWVPIGTDGQGHVGNSGGGFTGTFEGLGHTIPNLKVDTGSNDDAGLFGYVSGTVRDIGLTGGSTNGGSAVGALVGANHGAIVNAYATGTVTGGGDVGGLVGYSSGALVNVYATGAVGGAGDNVGGLVGDEYGGTIANAYANGAVNGTGDEYVGGLVGYQYAGTVTHAYATGAVNGDDHVGGLIGYVFGGTVSNVYATGAVIADQGEVGGLVGAAEGSLIKNAFATGEVSGYSSNLSGLASVGGLIGSNQSSTITNGYWNTETSGQLQSAGGTGLTTAQFQGNSALPSGVTFALGSAFSGGAAGGSAGLYPYLTGLFPNGVHAISGFAYNDPFGDAGLTPLASTWRGAVYVAAVANGTSLGPVTIGANGYYYIAASAGTFSTNDSLLTYTNADSTTGATDGATLAMATSAANQSGVDIYGKLVLMRTDAQLLSAASFGNYKPYATNLASGDSNASSAVAGTQKSGLVTSASNFTFDQPLTMPSSSSYIIATSKAGAPITVANPITINGNGVLGLISRGALAINASIAVTGAGTVALAAADDTTTVSGASLLELSFAPGKSLDFNGGSGAGAGLNIEGRSYTLLYSMADLDGIDSTSGSSLPNNSQANGEAGNYALAKNFDLTSYATYPYTNSPILGFSGTLEGLGHTITAFIANSSGNTWARWRYGHLRHGARHWFR